MRLRHLFLRYSRLLQLASSGTASSCLAAMVLVVSLSTNSAVSAALPDLGDPSAGVFSPVDEQRVGRQFMRSLRNRVQLVEDPQLNEYIATLRERLANAAGENPENYHFFIVDNPTLNAFAAPGGYVGLHTGLVLTAESESELAAVLAHEIAHVSQHHLARMISRAKDLSLPAMAAMVAAILVGGQAGTAALVATNAAVTADNLSYTRDFEREADAIGMRTLSAAGFDVNGMTRFFGRMQRWARVQEIDVPEFLRTHPLTVNRIAAAESRVSDYPLVQPEVSEEFQFARARVRALFASRIDQTVSEFAANIANGTGASETAERYGYALALSRASQHAAARREIDAAGPRLDPRRFALAKSEIEMAAGAIDASLATLAAAEKTWPDDTLIQRLRAAALMKSGNAAAAAALLEPMTRGDRPGEAVFKLYAQATAEIGNALASHQAMAEYHYSRDELDAAIAQLFSARPLTESSFYEAARVEARIQELNQEKVRYGE